MIKAVFFDIDGTLLSFHTHQMPQSTRTALEQLQEKGIKLFVASGRSPRALAEAEHLLRFSFDGCVLLNGQYCIAGSQVIHELPLSTATLQASIPYMKQRQIACEFVELDYTYLNHVNQKVLELRSFLGPTVSQPPVDDTGRTLSHTTYQLCAYISQQEESGFLTHVPNCRLARWNPLFVDVIHELGGKAVGLQKMLEHFGLSREECMAFGDGGNDIEMLRFAKIGVAMGNAGAPVKEAADYVTSDTDHDGIFSALCHFGLIE
ncbi:Cof-type HAD-IIB family hydrolase [Massilimaliae timonensis]|uniref:Cof-type HAD-IIB family hydrolase n=1 Tax=Massiliimalia timonensis TaxID=1987501 RepID=A0A8J6P3J9_9FIRM|nr:Cof-type HAD-IIB family hydrolase [Massiliimalia timonensis]MBC8612036.1 Cof-type HAD-IIB family hydrolase [Massiliimalia timonensis]